MTPEARVRFQRLLAAHPTMEFFVLSRVDVETLVTGADPDPTERRYPKSWTFTEYNEAGGKGVIVLDAQQADAIKRLLAGADPDPAPLPPQLQEGKDD